MLLENLLLGGAVLSLGKIAMIIKNSNTCDSSYTSKTDCKNMNNGSDNLFKDEVKFQQRLNKQVVDTYKEQKANYYKDTYNYCNQLTLSELYQYIEYNYKLREYDYKIYGTCSRDNKELIVKHISQLSEKLERPFTNRNSRY
ncbi:MAG: hypothetical protein RR359_03400 [Bacilli bacterium]